MSSNKPQRISLTSEQAEDLKSRIHASSLSDDDRTLLVGLISFVLWLDNQLNRAKLSITRLKSLFGVSTEKKKPKKPDVSEAKSNPPAEMSVSPLDSGITDDKTKAIEPQPPKKSPQWDPKKNHGRYSAKDYTGCEQVFIKHQELSVGSQCPECAECNTPVKLSYFEPGMLIRLVGQP